MVFVQINVGRGKVVGDMINLCICGISREDGKLYDADDRTFNVVH